jgi:Ti-type conjugative transfer relaxase TraA
LFSTRRREIQDELDARGEHSPRAARVAALETRQAKDYGVDVGALRDRWLDQALEAGHAPETIAAIGQIEPAPITAGAERDATDVLLGAHGLTEQATTFDRRAVLRGWCEHLPAGAPITTIEELADRTLADARVIALHDRDPYPKYSTAELIALEQHLVDTALGAIDTGAGVVAEEHLRVALEARPELSPEQVAAVAAITTSGDGVDVIVAAAGTGKTFSLDAAGDAWRRGGYQVIGAALAATAAAQLQTQTGIPSDTIALRTLQLANGTLHLDRQTVVVIDEAAMASTRGLVRLLDAAYNAGAKVVMVGDPRQLDAIDAGGLLNGLASRLPPITLTQNRRQQQPWEREALADLRAGRVAAALDGYNNHDRVVVADTAIDVRNHMAADWHAATLAGNKVLMLAERHYDVDDLNQRARRHLTRNRTITGPALDVDDLTFQAGDRVMCLRNDRRIGVRNGTIGTVTHIDPDRRSITIRTDRHTTHELPARYLDAGHVRYGYALTIHKSQGITVDRCLVLASDTLDRQSGYTALSRGRNDNRIYLVAQPPTDPEAHHPERDTPDPNAQLAAALQPDRRERLAIDHHIDTNLLREDLALLYRGRARLDSNRPALLDRRADIRALQRERQDQNNALDRAQHVLDAKRPVLHRREHNLARLAAERARDQATAAIRRIDDALEQARDDQHVRETHNRNTLDEIRVIDFAIRDRLDKLVDTIAHQAPDYLQRLGPRPTDPSVRHYWNNIVRDVEAYRIERDITDPRRPFGACPTENVGRAAWHQAAATFAIDADQLGVARDSLSRGQQRDQGLEIEL